MKGLLWKRIAIALVLLVAVTLIAYRTGARVERSKWQDGQIDMMREAERLRRDVRDKQKVIDDLESSSNKELAESLAALQRVSNELDQKIDVEPFVIEVPSRRECAPVYLPDVHADYRLFNCAISARDCPDLSDTAEAGGGDDPL